MVNEPPVPGHTRTDALRVRPAHGRCEADFDRPVHAMFGLPFDAIGLEAAVEHLRRCAEQRRPCFVSTPNVNFAVAAQTDPVFRDSVLRSDLSLIDGMPLVWVARLLGLPLRERVAGSDLFERLRRCEGEPLKVYFFGGQPGIAERAGAVLNAEGGGLRCVGHTSPGFGSVEQMSTDAQIEHINASGADFLVVALGAKKGQAWIEHNRGRLVAPLISHLGAVVNFVAGDVHRAPRGLQRVGLEWLWRIKAEPALWRRYARDGWALARLLMTRVLPYAYTVRRRSPAAWELADAAVEHQGTATCDRLVLRGAWNASNAQALRPAFARAAAGVRPLEIDLSAVKYLDAAVVALLSLLWVRCASGAQGWRLLGEMQPQVRSVLRLSCAEYLIPSVAPTRRDAVPEGRFPEAGFLVPPHPPFTRTPKMTHAEESAKLRLLIVAEHASAQFGGEAALPLHYFRVFRQRGMAVWLVTHARRRAELTELFADETRIRYIEDTRLHRLMHRLSSRLPSRIAYFTLGFVSRLSTQLSQRRVLKGLIAAEGIDVVHQPMPVSPREPSMLFGFGVPVIIGPMNGGMDYPPGFRRQRGLAERLLFGAGKQVSGVLNRLMPGKRQADLLLVANERTRQALPKGVSPHVQQVVENGVDLSLWRPATVPRPERSQKLEPSALTRFVYMGRLVDWKSVDILLHAFKAASLRANIRLVIIGDGVERPRLQTLAASLHPGENQAPGEGSVCFTGWLSQRACAEELAAADCLVLPSILECGGAVVLEAMSMSKPVIATAWGGPLDYLDPSCGVLVPPESPERLRAGFADAMVRLAQSPAERESMGRAGRAKVLSEYDWEIKADQILGLYRTVCRHHRK